MAPPVAKATKRAARKSRGKVNEAALRAAVRRAMDVEPLRLGEIMSGPEAEAALAMEAFRRGADLIGGHKVVQLRRDAVRRSARAHDLRGLATDFAPLSGRLDYDPPFDPFPLWEEYRDGIRAEWNTIPGWIKHSFDFPDTVKKKVYAGVVDDDRRFAAYMLARPIYYVNGYSRPASQILLKLEQPQFLGHKVGGGVSKAFADGLAEVESLLAIWGSELTKSAAAFRQIYGFVPRFIAGTTTLSNHSYGLAVDIDASTNPHLKAGGKGPSRPVFEVLEKVTGHDFGESFEEAKLPAIDQARAIHEKQLKASDKLKAWLKLHLPEYIAMARAEAGKPNPKSPLWKEDEFTANLPTQTTLEARDVKVLVDGYSLDGVKTWARQGIQTIPVELAAAFMQSGFRWGSEYESSKDVMHFELMGHAKLLGRDSGPRPLDDLILPGQHTDLHLVSDQEWVRGRW